MKLIIAKFIMLYLYVGGHHCPPRQTDAFYKVVLTFEAVDEKCDHSNESY